MDLAMTVKEFRDSSDFLHFSENVRKSRYRNGVVEGYPSRLHYTTDWIRQGEHRGIVEDLTVAFGGDIYDHPINYMSTHYQRYPALAKSKENLEAIKEIEK